MFGLPIEGEHTRYWGARAIYSNRMVPVMRRHRGKSYTDYKAVISLDILHDRQGFESKDPAGDKDFGNWVNEVALPWLRKECGKRSITTDSSEVMELKDGNRLIRATPNSSHGYMYIGAAELAAETKEVVHGS